MINKTVGSTPTVSVTKQECSSVGRATVKKNLSIFVVYRI